MTSLAAPSPAGETATPAGSRAPARSAPAVSRDRRDQRQQGDTFDRLLRRKTEEPEPAPPPAGAGDDRGPVNGLLALAGWLPGAPVALLAKGAKAVASPPPAPATPAESGTPTAAGTFEAAAGTPAPLVLAPGVAEDASAWQVTLNDPQGLPVELRVSRPEGTGAESAPWNLTVGAGAQHATLLAQHVQRLGERLRTRAVALAHLRVESDAESPHSD